MSEFIVVMITASDAKEAVVIGKTLVKEKLAACVNLTSQIQSIFFWDGKICEETEVLLLVKTCIHLLDAIKKRVKELHRYDVPEIIALPVIDGSEEYLSWVKRTIS